MSRYTVCFGAKLTTSGPSLRNGKMVGICPITLDEIECNPDQSHKCQDCQYPWISDRAWKHECRKGDYVDAKCPQCKNFYYKKASDLDRGELNLEIVGEMMETFGKMNAISFYKLVIRKQRDFPSRRDIWEEIRDDVENGYDSWREYPPCKNDKDALWQAVHKLLDGEIFPDLNDHDLVDQYYDPNDCTQEYRNMITNLLLPVPGIDSDDFRFVTRGEHPIARRRLFVKILKRDPKFLRENKYNTGHILWNADLLGYIEN